MKSRFRFNGLLCALIGLSVVQLIGCTGVSRGATPERLAPEPAAVVRPAAPTGVRTSPGNSQVGLTWAASSGATSYHVKRSTTSGGPYTVIASPDFEGYTDMGVSNNVTYYYVISAVNSAGESGNSIQVSAKPTNIAVPAAPSTISAKAGNAMVSLSWSASATSTIYRVKRSTTSGGPYATIDSTTFEGYTDVSRKNGVTYYYVVAAANTHGEGPNSHQVSATPSATATSSKPAAPGGLTAAPGNGQVGLSWSAPSGATSYKVKRGTTSGGPYTQIATSTFAGYTNVGLANGTTYYYVVSAVNASGEGANSSQASAKPVATSSGVTSVTVSPSTASSLTSGTLPFKATVVGTTTNKNVTWRAVRGRITSTGLYTAPSTAGTDTVSATSNADWSKFDTTVVNVTAPAPPPSNPTPDPAPVPSSGSGLSDKFFGLSISEINASHYPTVQFGTVRLWDTNTSWDKIEGSRGVYSWSELDTWLRSVSSHGQDSMYTFGRVPHWASVRPGESCPYDPATLGCAAPPYDISEGDNIWKEFVTAVVKHSLSSPELHIAYYEMWNEPDLSRNWTGTPAQLATMAKDAYAIIHALDPKAKLVGPGASTANQYGVHYLPDYYAAGAANAQDIVGLHAYLYDGSSFSNSPAAITTSISQLKALMAKYNISSKPIWFTEGNWNGDGGGTLTDAQKAAYLAQEYMLMWSTGSVARYYWYAWDARVGNLWSPTTGLKPAGNAYKLLGEWLIGSTHSTNPCTKGSDGTWKCALTLSSGYPAEIIWNAGATKTITLDTAFVTFRTLSSSTVHSIASHQVSIGPLPILAVKSQAVQ